MQHHPLTIESASFDVLEDLVHQAQAGDATTLPTIRHLLDQVPEVWADSRVLAHRVERSWMLLLRPLERLRFLPCVCSVLGAVAKW